MHIFSGWRDHRSFLWPRVVLPKRALGGLGQGLVPACPERLRRQRRVLHCYFDLGSDLPVLDLVGEVELVVRVIQSVGESDERALEAAALSVHLLVLLSISQIRKRHSEFVAQDLLSINYLLYKMTTRIV